MNPPVRFGLILGIVVAALGYVLPIAGLHTKPTMHAVFLGAAMVVNMVCVFLALRQTAADAAWMGQVVNALIVGAIGAVLIFAGSWTMTTWVFPEYFAEYTAGIREGLAAAGQPADRVAAEVAALEEAMSANSAFAGAIGAIITSAVAGTVVGIFKRKGR